MLYLTRFGHKASDDSEDGLKEGKDYFLISYYTHIYNWICKLDKKRLSADAKRFKAWLDSQIYGQPDLYVEILNDREQALENIPTVKQCGDGLRQYIMWHRIIPELRKFAEANNLTFEVSDRFEFKTLNSYIKFISNVGKEIKFSCGKRNKGDFWSGINVNGLPITPCDWDFEALLNYEEIIKAITTKVEYEILTSLI